MKLKHNSMIARLFETRFLYHSFVNNKLDEERGSVRMKKNKWKYSRSDSEGKIIYK